MTFKHPHPQLNKSNRDSPGLQRTFSSSLTDHRSALRPLELFPPPWLSPVLTSLPEFYTVCGSHRWQWRRTSRYQCQQGTADADGIIHLAHLGKHAVTPFLNVNQRVNQYGIICLNWHIKANGHINSYRAFRPRTPDPTFFSSAHGTFPRTDHMLGHKPALTNLRRMK